MSNFYWAEAGHEEQIQAERFFAEPVQARNKRLLKG